MTDTINEDQTLIGSVNQEHQMLIQNLMQPGSDILQHISPERMHLLHAAVGISGEVGELEKAVWSIRAAGVYYDGHPAWFDPYLGHFGVDVKNLCEESGDILFYSGAYRQGLLVLTADTSDLPVCVLPPLDCVHAAFDHVVLLDQMYGRKVRKKEQLCNLISTMGATAGELLDVTKKCAIYNAPLAAEKALSALNNLEYTLRHMLCLLGFTEEQVRSGNITKLCKRYPAGYSNQAAMIRADKEGSANEQ